MPFDVCGMKCCVLIICGSGKRTQISNFKPKSFSPPLSLNSNNQFSLSISIFPSKIQRNERNGIPNPIVKKGMVLARLRDRKTPRKREIRPSLSRQRSQGSICRFLINFQAISIPIWIRLILAEQIHSGVEGDIQGANWKVQNSTPA